MEGKTFWQQVAEWLKGQPESEDQANAASEVEEYIIGDGVCGDYGIGAKARNLLQSAVRAVVGQHPEPMPEPEEEEEDEDS